MKIAHGVPVIASRIPGNIGMLGGDYAGYYALGNERAVARVLWRAESDPDYYRLLKAQSRARRHLVTASRERNSLHRLVAEFARSNANRQEKETAKRTKRKSAGRTTRGIRE